jgi:general secretion pathway protein N
MQSPWSGPERPSPLWRRLAIGAAALAAAALVVLVEAPASLAGTAVRSWSGGRIGLDDAAGTLWNGQADVVLSSGDSSGDAITQSATRLPGRLAWRLSPWRLLLGTVDLGLIDPAILDLPLNLRLDRSANATIDPNRLRLPASVLLGLGAPWNTIIPGGELQLGWDALHLQDGALRGALRADWLDASSRLSPVVPFGHYRLLANGVFDGAVLQLETVSGPMEMSGNGTITAGKQLRFQGTARVQAGTDAATATQLSGLISLLGRRDGDGALLNFGT